MYRMTGFTFLMGLITAAIYQAPATALAEEMEQATLPRYFQESVFTDSTRDNTVLERRNESLRVPTASIGEPPSVDTLESIQ